MVALEKGHAVTFASNIRHGGHRVTKGLRCSSDAYISKMHACMHACIRVHTHTHAYAHTHARTRNARAHTHTHTRAHVHRYILVGFLLYDGYVEHDRRLLETSQKLRAEGRISEAIATCEQALKVNPRRQEP